MKNKRTTSSLGAVFSLQSFTRSTSVDHFSNQLDQVSSINRSTSLPGPPLLTPPTGGSGGKEVSGGPDHISCRCVSIHHFYKSSSLTLDQTSSQLSSVSQISSPCTSVTPPYGWGPKHSINWLTPGGIRGSGSHLMSMYFGNPTRRVGSQAFFKSSNLRSVSSVKSSAGESKEIKSNGREAIDLRNDGCQSTDYRQLDSISIESTSNPRTPPCGGVRRRGPGVPQC